VAGPAIVLAVAPVAHDDARYSPASGHESRYNATRMDDTASNHEATVLRDRLALDRTRLANERTLLSYLRTALMLIVTGATAIKFVDINTGVLVTGWLFVIAGAAIGLVGVRRFLAMRASINCRDH
jgi:putative membrane protein